jgi:hypothetical protein
MEIFGTKKEPAPSYAAPAIGERAKRLTGQAEASVPSKRTFSQKYFGKVVFGHFILSSSRFAKKILKTAFSKRPQTIMLQKRLRDPRKSCD